MALDLLERLIEATYARGQVTFAAGLGFQLFPPENIIRDTRGSRRVGFPGERYGQHEV